MPKVLLVEDHDLNRDMLSRRLRRRALDVFEAVDGLDCLRKVSENQPDLILMDMSLPGIDGWEAARRLKADEATRDIPIIGLSAHVLAGDREKGLAAGCDDYDTKPIDFARLLGKIQALLGIEVGGLAPRRAPDHA